MGLSEGIGKLWRSEKGGNKGLVGGERRGKMRGNEGEMRGKSVRKMWGK